MHLSKTTGALAVAAALALPSAAFAQDEPNAEHGKATAPGQLCKAESKKKVEGQKKSAFAACVTGAAKAQKDLRKQERAAAKAERQAAQQS